VLGENPVLEATETATPELSSRSVVDLRLTYHELTKMEVPRRSGARWPGCDGTRTPEDPVRSSCPTEPQRYKSRRLATCHIPEKGFRAICSETLPPLWGGRVFSHSPLHIPELRPFPPTTARAETGAPERPAAQRLRREQPGTRRRRPRRRAPARPAVRPPRGDATEVGPHRGTAGTETDRRGQWS